VLFSTWVKSNDDDSRSSMIEYSDIDAAGA
jgi:hypothetical protein